MKHIFTVCVFVFALIMSTADVTAQDTDAIRAMSAEQTKELRNDIKTLTSQQKSQVYEAFKVYNKRKVVLEGNKANVNDIKENEAQLRTTMKKILDSEQFTMFLKRYKENK